MEAASIIVLEVFLKQWVVSTLHVLEQGVVWCMFLLGQIGYMYVFYYILVFIQHTWICDLVLIQCTVRINKIYTFPFCWMDRPFSFHFLFPFVQHMFDFSACSVSFFSLLIFYGKGHFVCLNSCFGKRKFHMLNYMYVAMCSRRRIRLSQLLGRTLAMVFSEYTKWRILFHQAKGYRAPTCTITDKLRDEGIVVRRKGVSDFLLRVEKTCITARCPSYIHKLTLLLYLLLTHFQHRLLGHFL